MTLGWWMLGLVALAGCGSEDHPVQPLDDAAVSRVLRKTIPLGSTPKLDILFVIDSSPMMAPFATKLSANARELIRLLTPAFGPDLHVGVVTADPADAGGMRQTAAVAGSFITTELQFDTTVQTNVTGSIEDAFAALAAVGSAGSASAQPLAMARAALGANPGFVRDNALLGVVFVTVQDDSSAGTVEDFAAALRQLKPDDVDKIVVSVAAGPCSTGALSAPAAPRLTALVAQFPNRSAQVAICDDSLDGLVALETQLLTQPLGVPCIDAPVKTPPACAVWLERPATAEQRLAEPCPASTVPCWSLVDDSQRCPAPPSQALQLEPAGFRSNGATMEIECVLE